MKRSEEVVLKTLIQSRSWYFCKISRPIQRSMKKHKTEQDVKMRELEIDMKKYKTENNNMMKVIQRLESENQKNQARIIDLEEEVWKIFCEKEEC